MNTSSRKIPTPCPGCGQLSPHKECIYRPSIDGLVAAYTSIVLPPLARLEELKNLPEGSKGSHNQLLRRIKLEELSPDDIQTVVDEHTTLTRRIEAVAGFNCDYAKDMKLPLPPAARK